MTNCEKIKIQPYARLLTMLSEQLIKNEVVALTEIVKNSYDADAKWVKITFENFNKNMTAGKNSKIIIEDSGCGMSDTVLKDDFINPASAHKKIKKESGEKTKSGRIYQGEKGIGRFSLFKLGKKIAVITKTTEDDNARRLEIDLSKYEDEFIKQNNEQYKLSDIDTYYYELDYTNFNSNVYLGDLSGKRLNQGTIIIVENLNDKWGRTKIDKLKTELFSLIGNVYGEDFQVYFFNGDSFLPTIEITEKKALENIIQQKAVFKVNGFYDESNRLYDININSKHESIDFKNKKLMGLSLWKDFVKELLAREESPEKYITTCGDFKFDFSIFDPDKQNVRNKYKLDDADWELIKKNRVFLYRDGIRVFPYGSVNDDWLQVDTIRGTKRASAMFSNDQVVGYINITYEKNINLKDKTNREGLLEVGNSYTDFVRVIQILLQYLKVYHYNEYGEQKKVIKKFDKNEQLNLQNEFDKIIEICKDENLKQKLTEVKSKVEQQNDYNLGRIKVVEDLAGIGLSIQATHHDLNNFLSRCYNIIDEYTSQLNSKGDLLTESAVVLEKMERLRGVISAMETILVDMKNLFSSTQQKAKLIRVSTSLDRVIGYYKNIFEQRKIAFELKIIGDNPLVISIPEALLMTIFINILDNALYWLENEGNGDKKIRITINSNENYVLFSDSGPGIFLDEKDKIFEAFFTGKGIEGRGLGLYICRQFLDRYDYTIKVEESSIYKLSGANFLISFNKEV